MTTVLMLLSIMLLSIYLLSLDKFCSTQEGEQLDL